MQTERLLRSESQVQPESRTEQLLPGFLLSRQAANFSPKTLRNYAYTIGAFKKWLDSEGIATIERITPPILRSYMKTRIESGEKPHSTHTHYRDINTLFHWLEREELVAKNPMDRVDRPKLPKELLPPLAMEEVRQLEKPLQGNTPIHFRNRALFYLLLDTGLRVAECTNMRVGDINMETGVWVVTGKGKKDRIVRLGTTGLKHMNKYLQIRQGAHGAPLWLGQRGPMTVAGIMETLEKLGIRAGVHVSAHQLRRTFAVLCLRNGMDLINLRNLMGHASIETTQQYLSLANEDMVEAHTKFSPLDNMSRGEKLPTKQNQQRAVHNERNPGVA